MDVRFHPQFMAEEACSSEDLALFAHDAQQFSTWLLSVLHASISIRHQ